MNKKMMQILFFGCALFSFFHALPAISQVVSTATTPTVSPVTTALTTPVPAATFAPSPAGDPLPPKLAVQAPPPSPNLHDGGSSVEAKKKPSWIESLAIIVYADAVMSVENVLIIAVIVSEVPVQIRMVAVFFGLLAAGIFRIFFASIATILMKYPVVALLGSVTLVFLAVSLCTDTLKQIKNKTESPGKTHEKKMDWATVKKQLRRMTSEKGFWSSPEGEALKTVLATVTLQDILLSLDNVLVVAGNSHGDLWLTIVGVLISILMMGTIANFMVSIVKKYPVLGFIGGMALAKAAYNLYTESYNPEAAVIAFGSILVFIMFGRVYKKMTSPDEEVKPLTISLEGIEGEGKPAEEAKVPTPEAQLTPAMAGGPLPDALTQELLAFLKKNNDALNRIESFLSNPRQEE